MLAAMILFDEYNEAATIISLDVVSLGSACAGGWSHPDVLSAGHGPGPGRYVLGLSQYVHKHYVYL